MGENYALKPQIRQGGSGTLIATTQQAPYSLAPDAELPRQLPPADTTTVRIDFHDLVAETLGDRLELADLVVNGLIDGRRAHVEDGVIPRTGNRRILPYHSSRL